MRTTVALAELTWVLLAAAGPIVPGAAVRSPAADFVLVSEGRPRAEIHLAEREATGPVLFAVQELQRYVEALSGATLPVVRTAALDTTAARAITVTAGAAADPNGDHYVLRVSETGIAIRGSTPRAALYAMGSDARSWRTATD